MLTIVITTFVKYNFVAFTNCCDVYLPQYKTISFKTNNLKCRTIFVKTEAYYVTNTLQHSWSHRRLFLPVTMNAAKGLKTSGNKML